MKAKYLFVIWVSTFYLISCNNQTSQIESLTQERDALILLLSERDSAASEMNNFMEVIASSLDSIKEAEGIYTLNRTPEGVLLKTNEIKNNLNLLEDVIRRQRENRKSGILVEGITRFNQYLYCSYKAFICSD